MDRIDFRVVLGDNSHMQKAKYVDHRETAPMLLEVWGETLAPVIAKMIVTQPSLGSRLALAKRRVIHSVAAFVYSSLENGDDAAEFAEMVEYSDVRDLLALAVGTPHPRLFGMLDRLGSSVVTLETYRQLNNVLHSPAAAVVLDASEVTDHDLQTAGLVAADQVLLAARKIICSQKDALNLLASALAFLRALRIADSIERLPTGSGWGAINRRIIADLGRVPAAVPPFAFPDGWRGIKDLADFWTVGVAMSNCIARLGLGGEDRMQSLLSGEAAFLVRETAPMALAWIERVGPALWVMKEVATREGKHLKEVRQTFRRALASSMATSGHMLLDTDPFYAFYSIALRAEHDPLSLFEAVDFGSDQ